MSRIPARRRTASHSLRIAAALAVILTPAAFTAILPTAAAASPQRAVFQPAHHRSASGTWDLLVDPHDRKGAGGATYTLTRDGAVAWTGERSFALAEVAVAETGAVLGWARSHEPGEAALLGRFRVVVLSPAGETLRDEVHPRTSSRFVHGAPDPRAKGLFVIDASQRGVVRIADPDVNAANETWWVYELATGEKHHTVRRKELLDDPALRGSMAARALPGTPLVLVHWHRYDEGETFGAGAVGATFTLLGPDWRSIWTLDLPGDYEDPGERGDFPLLDRMRETGAIHAVGSDGRFTLRFFADAARVSFRATRVAGAETGWSVRELAREPFDPLAPDPPPPAAEAIALELLAAVPLGGGDPARGPIRDVVHFEPTEDGGARFVRRERAERVHTLVRVGPRGETVREVSLGPLPVDAFGAVWTPSGAEDWLLFGRERVEDRRSRAWRVDGRTGRLAPLEGWSGPRIDAAAETADGGFIVLGDLGGPRTTSPVLLRYDGRGRPRWSVDDYATRSAAGAVDPAALRAPADLALLPDGRSVVVDPVRDGLQVFGPDGAFLRAIDLATAFGSAPHYPVKVVPRPDGSVIVLDGGALWTVPLDDPRPSARRVRPTDPDGVAAGELDREVRVAPDGTVWTTDGHLLLPLDETGRIARVLGEPASPDRVTEARPILVDGVRGRVLVQDDRTASLFGFDARGERVLHGPGAHDDVDPRNLRRIVPAPDGGVWVERDRRSPFHVRFAPDGERVGAADLGVILPAFHPVEPERWGVRDDALVALRADGTVSRAFARRPDGRFFERVESIAFAPDGRCVVRDRTDLVQYAADGKGAGTIALPPDAAGRHLSMAGGWIAVADWQPDVLLVEVATGRLHRFRPEVEPGRSSWSAGLAANGRELWLVRAAPLTLLRFALPAGR